MNESNVLSEAPVRGWQLCQNEDEMHYFLEGVEVPLCGVPQRPAEAFFCTNRQVTKKIPSSNFRPKCRACEKKHMVMWASGGPK